MTPLHQAAYDIGAKGSEPTEEERLAFEAWMRGHCWAVIGDWDGKSYKHAHEAKGFMHGGAMDTRRLWAAWRDRGALAAQQVAVPLTDDQIKEIMTDTSVDTIHAVARAIEAHHGIGAKLVTKPDSLPDWSAA